MRAKIAITIKPDVLDPQGKAVLHALHDLGFSAVADVRVGKYFEVELEAGTAEPEAAIAQMCEKLLANPVVESYHFTLDEGAR
ncbi:MAG: phosphoribosylformylglycinamidine synthase subunit PurS [Myxococcales bacterium]|nr:phosphoribosylformylglycinamidine synthase subunit PurS [Myxococcales bacterium]